MAKKDDLSLFYDSFVRSMESLEVVEDFPEYFYSAMLSGDHKVYQKNITETKTFEEEWIQTVESYFPSIDKITKNPKSGLRYDEEIVAIEKAKKFNSASIRHLASHTHLIKEVRDDMVVPKKIMTQTPEIEYGVYENRFIMTLIERLFTFVRSRYEIIKTNVESFQKKHLNYHTEFQIQDTQVELDLDVTLKEDLDNPEINKHNLKLLDRVEQLNRLMTGLRSSPFMELMEKEKPVQAPIMKTQVILKNPDFRNAYNLWLFLDKYNTLGYDIDVEEKNLPLDKSYLQNVYQGALVAFTIVAANQKYRKERYDSAKAKGYRRKGTKVVKTHVKDVVESPEALLVEDNRINEYYLEQTKKLFKKNLETYEEESSNYEVALRKALRDTIQVSNALYESYFELHEEEDVFKKLIKEQSAEKLLIEAREKARIARIVRETKEIDYNNAIRLEKKWMKEVEKMDKLYIKEMEESIVLKTKKAKEQEALKYEQLRAEKNQKYLDEQLDFVMKERKKLALEHKKAMQLLKEEAKMLQEKERQAIALEKQKANERKQKELARIKEKADKEKERLRIKMKKQRDLEKAKLAKEKEKMQKKTETSIKAKTKKIQEQTELAIAKAEKKATPASSVKPKKATPTPNE